MEWHERVDFRIALLTRQIDFLRQKLNKMAKRWNGKKMSHGKKDLARPVKKTRSKPAPKPTKKSA